MSDPYERWPTLFGAFGELEDPPPGLTGRQDFERNIKVGWNQAGLAQALAELLDFVAGGDSEERCRWLLDDMASMYDPLVDFPSYRDCVRWLLEQLEARSRAGEP